MEAEDNTLEHFGILGMKWGHRKGPDDGPSKAMQKMAKKDAQRFIDAKMFYGQTAGTKRKLLKAELDKKKKTIPGYEDAFNVHLESVDRAKSAQKAVNTRTRIDSVQKGRSLVKKVLGVTGSLTVGVGTMVYYANKPQIDAFVMSQANRLIRNIRAR